MHRAREEQKSTAREEQKKTTASTQGGLMAKRGRKKRDRKYNKANHGKRPNAGAKK
jgi:hypothetical protein